MLAQSVGRKTVILLAILGILNIHVPVNAEPSVAPKRQSKVPDVRLDSENRFHGMVVDGQGAPMPSVRLKLIRQNSSGDSSQRPLETTSDADGRFKIMGMAAGTYRIETSNGAYLFRLWTPSAAPPAAAPSLLVVDDDRIQRGQRPLRDMFHTDPLFVATVVTAAIAIPIIVHKSRGDSPDGS